MTSFVRLLTHAKHRPGPAWHGQLRHRAMAMANQQDSNWTCRRGIIEAPTTR
jgi:hypothetical protein